MKRKPTIVTMITMVFFMMTSNIVMAKRGAENPLVIDIPNQFYNLSAHGEPIGAWRVNADDACRCVHYQGIARANLRDGSPFDGTPYLLLTRSGNDGEGCLVDWGTGDWPCESLCLLGHAEFGCKDWENARFAGELVITALGSRNRWGERLRSNLLKRLLVTDDEDSMHMKETLPPAGDFAAANYHFDGTFPKAEGFEGVSPMYVHPGGMQLVDDILLVALEKSCEDFKPYLFKGETVWHCEKMGNNDGVIAFIDVSDPVSPELFRVVNPWPSSYGDKGIKLVAATYVDPDDVPFTLVPKEGRYLFMWTDNDKEYFFGWSNTDDLRTTTRIDLKLRSWHRDNADFGWRNWQTLNFVKSENGLHYLIGTDNNRGKFDIITGAKDFAALFRVRIDWIMNNIDNAIKWRGHKHMMLTSPMMGDFDAAGGAYVSPSGQLMLYSAAHDNLGPNGTLQMGEFRGIDLEGSLPFTGCAGWVELYSDTCGWIFEECDDDGKTDRSLIFDVADAHKDNWSDLDHYDDGFHNKASAVTWHLGWGYRARLYAGWYYSGDYIELVGDGHPHSIENLKEIPQEMFDDGIVRSWPNDINYFNDDIESVNIEYLLDPRPEVCDGLDNDCDGFRDEGLGHDNDKDGWGSRCDNCPTMYNPQQIDPELDETNTAPVASCIAVKKCADPIECNILASIDNNSYDPDGDSITLTQVPSEPYVIGERTVTLDIEDQRCKTASCDATVTVEDCTPPDISCPASLVAECQSDGQAVVDPGDATATDSCTSVTVNDPGSSSYPLGESFVSYTAIDDAGNESSCYMSVSVADTTVPVIKEITAKPAKLWPPNHEMKRVAISVVVDDLCDALPECQIVGVSSDEPINGDDDGNTSPDWIVTGDLALKLRAERSGTGDGRTYRVNIECVDGSGNNTAGITTINVPLNRK